MMTTPHNIKNTVKSESETVDRHSHEPAYIQIYNLLKNQIAKGEYLPGSRLPSESKLRNLYKVSSMTIRRSIKMLIDHGIVTTVQGSGTFVKAPDLNRVTFSLHEFYEIFKDKQRTKVTLLEVKTLKADALIADHLQVNEETRVISLRRIIEKDSDPIIFHREYLVYDPRRPIIETELEVTSLHGLFKGNGTSFFKWSDLIIEAMVLNQEEARLLNSMPLHPAFRIEHLFYDFNDRPLSWGQFVCRGDQLRFKTRVGLT